MWQCEPQPRARRVDECGSASRSRRRGESMNDERGEIAVKLRVGVFVLVALAAFLGMVYALGARARLFEAHYTIHAEFTEVAGLTEGATVRLRSEEHTSELQSRLHLVCRLLLEKKKKEYTTTTTCCIST